MHARRLVLAILFVLGALPAAPAAAVEVTDGPLYVIVPFGEPGANKVHEGTNVSAGLVEITKEALADAADQFANRPAAR